MTPQEFKFKIEETLNNEEDHICQRFSIEDLIYDLLVELGYGEGIETYRNSLQWHNC